MKFNLYLSVLLLTFFSCENIQHTEFLEVTSVTPEAETVNNIQDLENVTLVFSVKTNKPSIESSFSLTAGGEEIQGTILWTDSKTFTYTPFSGFYLNVPYEITVTTDAEDIYGNSLEENFIHSFSSSTDTTRPEIVEISPDYFEIVTDPFVQIQVEFNEPISLSSFLIGTTITPSIKGVWTWDTDYTEFVFTPTEPHTYNSDYTLTLKNTIYDISMNNIEAEINHIYRIEGDDTNPDFIELNNGDDIIIRDFSPYQQINGWAKEENVHLLFSEPMEKKALEAGITVEPTWDFRIEEITPDHFIMESEDNLIWDTLYLIKLDKKITDLYDNQLPQSYNFYIHINSPASRPPVVERAVLYTYDEPSFPAALNRYDTLYDINDIDHLHTVEFSVFTEEDNSVTPSIPDVQGCVDVYFTLAQDASIDFFNFAENFVMSSDDETVADINIWHIEVLSEISGDPYWGTWADLDADYEDYYVVRAYMDIDNDDTKVGYITIKLRSTFTDSYGNELSPSWETKVWGANAP